MFAKIQPIIKSVIMEESEIQQAANMKQIVNAAKAKTKDMLVQQLKKNKLDVSFDSLDDKKSGSDKSGDSSSEQDSADDDNSGSNTSQ